jgi:hypothetical protein
LQASVFLSESFSEQPGLAKIAGKEDAVELDCPGRGWLAVARKSTAGPSESSRILQASVFLSKSFSEQPGLAKIAGKEDAVELDCPFSEQPGLAKIAGKEDAVELDCPGGGGLASSPRRAREGRF